MNYLSMLRAVALCLSLGTSVAQAVTCAASIAPSNPDSVYTPNLDPTVAVNQDNTVTHIPTGLVWKRCSEGQSWNGATCTGTATGHTWAEALALAGNSRFAGQSDWRLPNIRELRRLVEECRTSPSINDAFFPATPSGYFWSGSPGAVNSLWAWYVSFQEGNANSGIRGNGGYHVRLVRGGQSFDSLAPATPTVTSVSPTSAIVGINTTFTVTGTALTTGMGFTVQDCAPNNAEVGIGSATQRTFACVPEVAGSKHVLVKDTPGGTVLFQSASPATPGAQPINVTVTTSAPVLSAFAAAQFNDGIGGAFTVSDVDGGSLAVARVLVAADAAAHPFPCFVDSSTSLGSRAFTIGTGNGVDAVAGGCAALFANGTRTLYVKVEAKDPQGNQASGTLISVPVTYPGNQWSLTVTGNGTGSGTVISAPAGIDCGSTCSASFNTGSVVTLTAAPASGSTFTGWTAGACTNADADSTRICQVTMDAAKSVAATFSLAGAAACGSANGQAYPEYYLPTDATEFCSIGSASALRQTGSSFAWTCSVAGGATVSCATVAANACTLSQVWKIQRANLSGAMSTSIASNQANITQTYNVNCTSGRFGVVRMPGIAKLAVENSYALVQSSCFTSLTRSPLIPRQGGPTTEAEVRDAIAAAGDGTTDPTVDLGNHRVVGPLATAICQY
ncbi:MAG TPA: DUF1566 domain-containing protein [Rhodoferax sp.]|nr:DUF1566 domain-containing protein [Rhodoferax sp.]